MNAGQTKESSQNGHQKSDLEFNADVLGDIGDLDDLLKLTSIDQIEQAFHYLEAAEGQTEEELIEILGKRSHFQKRFSELCHLGNEVEALRGSVSSICDNITNTAYKAKLISDKVKFLDNEQRKIESALNDAIMTEQLIKDVALIKKGIMENDIENSAKLLSSYISTNPEILENPFIQCVDWDIKDSGASTVSEYLQKAKSDIKNAVVDRFDDAVQRGDTKAISRCFKIFPTLGESHLGLDKYSEFLCDMIKDKSKIPLQSGMKKDSVFALRLTKLFEVVAIIIDNNYSIVETHYGGPGMVLRIIQWLELEVDRRVQSIFDAFEDDREISRVVDDVQQTQITKSRHRIPILASTSPRQSSESEFAGIGSTDSITPEVSTVDIKSVSSILSELSTMLGQVSAFRGFLISRAASDIESVADEKAREGLFLTLSQIQDAGYNVNVKDQKIFDPNTGLLISSSLEYWLNRMSDTYLVLERYVMQAAVENAMRMDDVDSLGGWDDILSSTFGIRLSGNSRDQIDSGASFPKKQFKGLLGASKSALIYTSSCVDDFFFVLQHTLERTISICLPKVLNDMVHTSLSHLQTYFLSHMEKQIIVGSGKPQQSAWRSNINSGSSSQSSMKLNELKHRMVALNNLGMSTDCLLKLTKNLKADIAESWTPTVDEESIKEANESLDTLTSFTSKLKNALNSGISQLVSQHAKSRVRSILQESYREVRYVLTEEEYEIVQDDNLFQRRFITKFNDLTSPYKQCLTTPCFRLLVTSILSILLNDWERAIFLSKFNLLGGIIFEKDLRAVQQYLEEVSSSLLRDKFVRLTQVAEILNIEEVQDVPEVWRSRTASDPIGWTLNENDIKKIDIPDEEVQGLKL
ncbi:Golgi transport complex subunit 4 [Mycoemilia scoparia]|uniref:Conserved oligomeric Golgi complex subunit 4 n=1 Tax=Mycoemilia scoparia TaxID=417184 RepID=A0A9W8A3K5_9FUNG|nr:Golgi transport complex subunit 4 [Mycoemilia scoparia]